MVALVRVQKPRAENVIQIEVLPFVPNGKDSEPPMEGSEQCSAAG